MHNLNQVGTEAQLDGIEMYTESEFAVAVFIFLKLIENIRQDLIRPIG